MRWRDYIKTPIMWQVVEERGDGAAFRQIGRVDPILVIASAGKEDDGLLWVHLSASKKTREPTWNELVEIKNLFLGEDAYAYQVVPSKAKHVNICDRVMHLFSCTAGNQLPDFTKGTGSL